MADDTHRSGHQLILGKILLERGVLSADQLKEALAERARRVAGSETLTTSLGAILVEKGFLTQDELDSLTAELKMEPAAPAAPVMAAPPVLSAPPPSLPPVVPAPSGPSQLGKYTLLRELGRGGMGVVHEAMDVQLNRKVALKLMLPNAAADPKDVAMEEERFVREAQLCAKLKHPNIVTVYEAGVLQGHQFLAMELVEGQPLNVWRQETQVSIREQVEVLRDVTLAVHYAHEQGILHRDLKPRNILIGGGNHPFVTDFGLAKMLGKSVSNSITGHGMVVGTPAYMSPEQAQGLEKIDWRTDIYSLGVILYEILTNTTPFTGESPIEILMKVVKDPVKPPSHVVPPERAMALDRTIESICLKAVAKQDRDRYITAKALADDLTKWLQGEEVKVALPKSKKKVAALPIAAAVFVSLLAVGGVFLYMARVPSVATEIAQARQFMSQQKYMDAMAWYIRALARDPENKDAKEGEKEAREALERRDKEAANELKTAREKASREAQQAMTQAAEKSRQEEAAASEEEKKRLAAEREALLARAREKTAEVGKVEAKIRMARSGILFTGPSATSPDDPWRQAVNLLPLVSLPRDAVWGSWTAQDGGVTSDRARNTRLALAYKPPEEYDLRVEFVRQSGTDAVRVYLSAAGRPFAWVMGAGGNTSSGLETIRGQRAHENPTTFRSVRCLENKRTYVTLIQVRKDGVRALLDGQPLVHWSGDVSELGLDAETPLSPLPLGIGSHESSTLFRRVELLEVSGKGSAVPSPSAPEFRSLPVDPAALKAGLVGEYFYGTDFEVLALRRIDSSLSFEWKHGAAWKEGPEEAFSARWTGYLQVPRSSKYLFSAAADDGIRVVLDGVQVLSGGAYTGQAPPETEVLLDRGFHRIVVEFFEKTYQASLVLSWADGALAKMAPIPSRFFFHDPAKQELPFEWVAAPEPLATLLGHTRGITALDWSRDGKHLASSSHDRRVRLWSLETRKESGLLSGHGAGVLAVAFSPDGRQVATGGYDKKIRVWDAAKASETHALEGHTNFVKSLAFSRSGALLASAGNDGSIRLWDPVAGGPVRALSGHEGGVTSVAFNGDGTRLASASVDQTVRLWDPVTGRETARFSGHADWVEAVAWSPDGKTVASASWDSTLRLWDTSGGREVRVIRAHRSEVMGLAFSPDGTELASCGNDAMVKIFEAATGRELRTLAGHAGPVVALAYTPDGRTLASAGDDGTVRLWSLKAK